VSSFVGVQVVDGRYVCDLRAGLLRPQQLVGPAAVCRIGLVATTALLLGGDEVTLSVRVGPGAVLELTDIAGTVAYDGAGRGSRWSVDVQVAAGGVLIWSGEPLVVADGADVVRDTRLDLAETATVLARDTVVLGRAGQVGGYLRVQTRVDVDGRTVLLEDLRLDPMGRRRPGILGVNRVIDSILAVGPRRDGTQASAPTYRLVGGVGELTRFLGTGLSESPLVDAWHIARDAARDRCPAPENASVSPSR